MEVTSDALSRHQPTPGDLGICDMAGGIYLAGLTLILSGVLISR